MLCLDIETLANPDAQPPEFTAAANLKDPEKIKASIEEKRQKWVDEAALHAERGTVALVGVVGGHYPLLAIDGEGFGGEKGILLETWSIIKKHFPIVGFNLIRFDIPFLVRRSWILGIPVPTDVVFDKRGFINPERFIDLMQLWACGDRQETISLDTMAKAILGRGKTGHGSDFGNLWRTDKDAAISYCKADVQLTWELAQRLIPNTKE